MAETYPIPPPPIDTPLLTVPDWLRGKKMPDCSAEWEEWFLMFGQLAAAKIADSGIATVPDVFEDFLGGIHQSATGSFGTHGWAAQGANNDYLAEKDHPGIVRLGTSGTAAAFASLALGTLTGAAADQQIIHSDSSFVMRYLARIKVFDTNTQLRIGAWIGLSGANPPTDGIYFEKANADTAWKGTCRAGGVQTQTGNILKVDAATPAGVSVDSWYIFQIRSISASVIGFKIEEGGVGGLAHPELTVTTNRPSAQMTLQVQVRTQVTTVKELDVDYAHFRISNLKRNLKVIEV